MTNRNLWARPWIAVAISLGVVMILAGLIALAWNPTFIIFARSLQVTAFESDGDGEYAADILDGNVRIADIVACFPSLVYGDLTRVPMRVSIWHESDMLLHSLKLTFSSDDFLQIALEVPDGYPWPSLEFHRMESDMNGVEFCVADLGIQGTGTVTLEFLVEMPPSQQTMNFDFYAQITMRKNAPLVFSQQIAEAQTDIESARA
nr:hypothetical protein [Candidatus Njordarchaeum guaymaensis]